MSEILFFFFPWNIWQRRTNSTKLAVKHHNVRLHIHSDSWQNLHSARCAQSQERCSNFSHKITRRVVLASLWKASYFKPAMSSSDWNSLVWLPFLNCKLSSINGESALMSRIQSFTKSSVARIFKQNCFNPSVSTRSTSQETQVSTQHPKFGEKILDSISAIDMYCVVLWAPPSLQLIMIFTMRGRTVARHLKTMPLHY